MRGAPATSPRSIRATSSPSSTRTARPRRSAWSAASSTSTPAPSGRPRLTSPRMGAWRALSSALVEPPSAEHVAGIRGRVTLGHQPRAIEGEEPLHAGVPGRIDAYVRHGDEDLVDETGLVKRGENGRPALAVEVSHVEVREEPLVRVKKLGRTQSVLARHEERDALPLAALGAEPARPMPRRHHDHLHPRGIEHANLEIQGAVLCVDDLPGEPAQAVAQPEPLQDRSEVAA